MDIFNILPMSDQRYNAGMKRLTNTFKFADNDEAKFRLQVLKHGEEFGWQSACSAYNICRATYFNWQKQFKAQGLAGLCAQSTKPHTYRQSKVHPLLIDYIKELRQDYGNLGRDKIKVFIDDYAKQIGVPTISQRTITRVISKYNLFEPTVRYKSKRRKIPTYRSKYAPKVNSAGFVEVDCVTLYRHGLPFRFVCCIDVYTRIAYVEQVKSLTSLSATQVLQHCQNSLPFPISTIQTDNGSEFLKDFDAHLTQNQIPHYFTLPHSPKINGTIERFNRTVQEEFLNRTDSMVFAPKLFKNELTDWVSWYNCCRPHAALGNQTPCAFFESSQSKM